MATFDQLQNDVRDLAGDPSSEANTWTPEQINTAINAAVLDYCKKTGVSYVETMISVDSTTGMVTLPTPSLEIHRVMLMELGS